MRYAVFSDVHSNFEALNAVIEACKKEGIERYLCIGDIVGYAANPKECIRLVLELSPVIVAGNHDWAACGKFGLEYFNPVAKEAIRWTKNILDNRELDLLSSLPLVYQEEKSVLVHSSLDSPEEFFYLNSIDEALLTFAKLESQICFIGHTHKPGVFWQEDSEINFSRGDFLLEGNRKYIANVGSVGQPRDRDPRACFAIYDTKLKSIELKRVSYDVSAAQEKIIWAGLPAFLASRLAEGR